MQDADGKIVITADNPVSCLYEYAKKVITDFCEVWDLVFYFLQKKIPDPDFDCIAENLLETWQRGNQTMKKVNSIFILEGWNFHINNACLDCLHNAVKNRRQDLSCRVKYKEGCKARWGVYFLPLVLMNLKYFSLCSRSLELNSSVPPMMPISGYAVTIQDIEEIKPFLFFYVKVLPRW